VAIAEIERLVAADVAIDDVDEVLARLSEMAADDPIRAGSLTDLIISHEVDNDRLARAEDDTMALAATLLVGGRTEEQEIGRRIQAGWGVAASAVPLIRVPISSAAVHGVSGWDEPGSDVLSWGESLHVEVCGRLWLRRVALRRDA
jgi:hypothetical protein